MSAADRGTLEERVAALEAMASAPFAPPDMTEEQVREFEREWPEALRRAQKLHVLPARQPLTQDEVRQLLAECVTVVKPGETLILRCGRDWTPMQVREIQDSVDAVTEWRDLGFRVLVVPADELGVAAAEVFHQAPAGGGGLMPCCGKTPFEVPGTDRMTGDPAAVTCAKMADPDHTHADGSDLAAGLLMNHMYRRHGMHMSGYGYQDMARTHTALHGPDNVPPARAIASGAGGHE